MKFNLSFWRFVIILKIAKTGTWAVNDNISLVHIGTITNGRNTAIRLIFIPILLDIGWIK